MTPDERIRYRLQGIENRLNRVLEPIERRLRMTRPETDEERWQRWGREAERHNSSRVPRARP